jgi:GAF domain-containing protein
MLSTVCYFRRRLVDRTTMKSALREVERVLKAATSEADALEGVCHVLAEEVPYYDWVGFYLVTEKGVEELVLGPFVGEPTEHVNIAFGQGICGQAASTERTFVIQDVTAESNYLSCSPEVKSEIVVPIFKDGELVGELDIDSHQINPFTEEDRLLLEEVAERVASHIP